MSGPSLLTGQSYSSLVSGPPSSSSSDLLLVEEVLLLIVVMDILLLLVDKVEPTFLLMNIFNKVQLLILFVSGTPCSHD